MLSMLKGKKFSAISRAIDMMCLFLGDDYSFSRGGERIDVSEFALHLQTTWRFRDGSAILLSSGDIYEPYDPNVPADWAYDMVGRPDALSNVFDVRAKEFMKMMDGAYAVDCRLSEANDITIALSNGVVFEQFMSESAKREEWRLIDYINDVHIVCFDENGEISRE